MRKLRSRKPIQNPNPSSSSSSLIPHKRRCTRAKTHLVRASSETYLKDFNHRSLVDPKWMDPSFFSDQGFHFQELLQFQGLNTFVSLHSDYLTELVKVFYSNLKLVDGDLVTELNGKPIRITPSDWLAVTGLRHDGVKVIGSEISKWEGYDRDTVVKGMMKDPSLEIPFTKLMAARLIVEDRMLHFALGRILIPRAHNCTQLLVNDVFLMWLMKQRVPINWPFYISNHMMKVKNRYMKDLPYAFLITKFLKHFQIDTRTEAEAEAVVVVTMSNKIAQKSLNHMMLKRVKGVWVTAGDPAGDSVQADSDEDDEDHDMDAEEEALQHQFQPAAQDEAHGMDTTEEEAPQHPFEPAAQDEAHGMDTTEEEAPQHPFAPAALDDQTDLLIAQIEDLEKVICKQLDHLNSSMASLDSRLKAVQNRTRLHNLVSCAVSLDARLKALEDHIRDGH